MSNGSFHKTRAFLAGYPAKGSSAELTSLRPKKTQPRPQIFPSRAGNSALSLRPRHAVEVSQKCFLSASEDVAHLRHVAKLRARFGMMRPSAHLEFRFTNFAV